MRVEGARAKTLNVLSGSHLISLKCQWDRAWGVPAKKLGGRWQLGELTGLDQHCLKRIPQNIDDTRVIGDVAPEKYQR